MSVQSSTPMPPGTTLLLCSGNVSSSPLTSSFQLFVLHRLGSAHWSPHHQSQLSCAHTSSPPSPRLALAVQQPLTGRASYGTSRVSGGMADQGTTNIHPDYCFCRATDPNTALGSERAVKAPWPQLTVQNVYFRLFITTIAFLAGLLCIDRKLFCFSLPTAYPLCTCSWHVSHSYRVTRGRDPFGVSHSRLMPYAAGGVNLGVLNPTINKCSTCTPRLLSRAL